MCFVRWFELVGGWRIRNGMEICCCLLLYLLGKAISCTNRHNCSRLQVKECVMREGYCLSKISNQVFCFVSHVIVLFLYLVL